VTAVSAASKPFTLVAIRLTTKPAEWRRAGATLLVCVELCSLVVKAVARQVGII
jgi:predicted naringenin-chalcone synthase